MVRGCPERCHTGHSSQPFRPEVAGEDLHRTWLTNLRLRIRAPSEYPQGFFHHPGRHSEIERSNESLGGGKVMVVHVLLRVRCTRNTSVAIEAKRSNIGFVQPCNRRVTVVGSSHGPIVHAGTGCSGYTVLVYEVEWTVDTCADTCAKPHRPEYRVQF